MTATTADLDRLGYARSFSGFWLKPDGLTVVSEPDALIEAARILQPKKAKR